MITALFTAGDFPDVRGGLRSSGHCSKGTFHYQGHKVILISGKTAFVIPIPRLTENTYLSYCMMQDQAYLGTFILPVYIYSDNILS